MSDSHISQTKTDLENSKKIAERLFNIYDINNKGFLDDNEIKKMMQDTYKSINKAFNPSDYDIETMKKTLDYDQNGKIDIRDVEKMIEKWMCCDDY